MAPSSWLLLAASALLCGPASAFLTRPGLVPTPVRAMSGLSARGMMPLMAKMTPEEEAEERSIQAELDRKMRGLFNADGTPYAPWILKQVDLEASARAIRRRRQREKELLEEDVSGVILDPQGQEMAGSGLRYRLVGDNDVELGWITNQEKDNVGFIIFRKRADETGDFDEVANFKSFPPLNSKGLDGGFYSFVDEGVEPGQYIYRVSDQDKRGKRTVLCQVGVEITSKSEQLQKFAIIGAFAALGVGAVISSVLYQPIQ